MRCSENPSCRRFRPLKVMPGNDFFFFLFLSATDTKTSLLAVLLSNVLKSLF